MLYTGPAGNPGNQYKRTDSGLEIEFDPSASTEKEYAAAINEDNHKPFVPNVVAAWVVYPRSKFINRY